MHRSISVAASLAVLLVTGCSGGTGTPAEQDVAVCLSPEGELPSTGSVNVEFRQEGEVVATVSGPVGFALGARLPAGVVQVYVNGELHGTAGTDDPGAPGGDGGTVGSTYLSGPGCPDPPLG
ncbi:MAG: hypothetical protein H5T83_12950 [Actinotalea sp.]|nr:hypothetical protein [Actinotalea sp.]